MRKILGAIIILFTLNFSVASAEIIPVEGVGRYVIDNKLTNHFLKLPKILIKQIIFVDAAQFA